MSVHLDPRRPASDEVHRAGVAHLTKAIEALTAASDESALGEAVHVARKQLKRTRALLRLVRASFDGETYREEMALCRDVGRQFSAPRDAHVLVQTARTILDEAADPPRASVEPIVEELEARRDRIWRALSSEDAEFTAALGTLDGLAQRAEVWRFNDLDWAKMALGLSASYRKGRRAFRAAGRDGDPQMFHETRKRTKDLWYQFELVRDAWKPVLKGAAKGAEGVADLLGQIQDLEVLRSTILTHPLMEANPDGADLFVHEIERRLRRQRADALVAGAPLFAEKPGAFEARILAYVGPADVDPTLAVA